MSIPKTKKEIGDLKLSSPERIKKWGHRAYVGGTDSETWFDIGRRQYHFLVSRGLNTDHTFLDIACGALRLGQFLIPMLKTGRYLGLEAEPDLVRAGIREEMLFDIVAQKQPRFSYGYDFDFSFVETFDYAIAQSLFTHLIPNDIQSCLQRLRGVSNAESQFYFTYKDGNSNKNPDGPSHANRGWKYSFAELEGIAKNSGWELEYIGDWGHERSQLMVLARPDNHRHSTQE